MSSPEGTQLQDARRVFLFESAYDAMAFYQMLSGKESNLDAKDKMEKLENTAGEAYWQSIDYGGPIRVCVKIADFLEAMYWLMEHGEGSYANNQLHGLNERFHQYLEGIAPLWKKAATELWKDLSDVNAETTTFQRVNYLRANDA